MTVSKWASVDDFIADYERGYFCNGAVPAGMLSIVSNDPQDFQRNKQRIEDSFRGAGNANGVLYNMVPVDPSTNSLRTCRRFRGRRSSRRTTVLIWLASTIS